MILRCFSTADRLTGHIDCSFCSLNKQEARSLTGLLLNAVTDMSSHHLCRLAFSFLWAFHLMDDDWKTNPEDSGNLERTRRHPVYTKWFVSVYADANVPAVIDMYVFVK